MIVRLFDMIMEAWVFKEVLRIAVPEKVPMSGKLKAKLEAVNPEQT